MRQCNEGHTTGSAYARRPTAVGKTPPGKTTAARRANRRTAATAERNTDAARTVIGYLRVSTADQADSGAGLAAQRATITAEAARRGWLVQWVEDAGYSAGTLARPGLKTALALLSAGDASVLVVAKLDRVSRSVQNFASLTETARRQGWAMVCLDLGVDTTTPAGELVANVMAAVATWERRVIGARTSEALAAKKAAGVRLGRPVATPAAVRQRVAVLAATGASHGAVARQLNAEGVPTVHGATWHRSGVRSVLMSLALDAVAKAATS